MTVLIAVLAAAALLTLLALTLALRNHVLYLRAQRRKWDARKQQQRRPGPILFDDDWTFPPGA